MHSCSCTLVILVLNQNGRTQKSKKIRTFNHLHIHKKLLGSTYISIINLSRLWIQTPSKKKCKRNWKRTIKRRDSSSSFQTLHRFTADSWCISSCINSDSSAFVCSKTIKKGTKKYTCSVKTILKRQYVKHEATGTQYKTIPFQFVNRQWTKKQTFSCQ